MKQNRIRFRIASLWFAVLSVSATPAAAAGDEAWGPIQVLNEQIAAGESKKFSLHG